MIFELAEDLMRASAALPAFHPRRKLLGLLEEAVRRDVEFLSRHSTALFQCVWNSGRWYDGPRAEKHYLPPEQGWPEGGPPWARRGEKLSALLEAWRERRDEGLRSPCWLRSLRPPRRPLGTAQTRVLQGHEGGVRCLAIAPDGRRLVSGGEDGTVRLWDVESGRCEHILWRGGKRMSAVTFSADGERIAAGGWDGIVRRFDARTAEMTDEAGPFPGNREFAFGPDLGFAAMGGSNDYRVQLYDFRDGGVRDVGAHRGIIACLTVSRDGRLVASGAPDGAARVWDAESGEQYRRLPDGPDFDQPFEGQVRYVAFSPDGRRLVVVMDMAYLFDVESGEEIGVYSLGSHWSGGPDVKSVGFSPDGSGLVLGGADGSVTVHETASGFPRGELGSHENPVSGVGLLNMPGHARSVRAVAYFPDGRHVASAGEDGTIRIWQTSGGDPPARLRGADPHASTRTELAFFANGELLLSRGDSWIRFWDTASGEFRGAIQPLESWEGTPAFAISRHGGRLAVTAKKNTIELWTFPEGELAATLIGHDDRPLCLDFGADGRRLASGGVDTTVRVWDVGAERERTCGRGHTGAIEQVAFSPDGARVASAALDGSLRIWDAETGELLASLEILPVNTLGNVQAPSAGQLDWAPDGRFVVAAYEKGMIVVWEHATGEFRVYEGEHGWWERFPRVAVTSEGWYIISGEHRDRIDVWVAETGERLTQYDGKGDVRAVAAQIEEFPWLPWAKRDGLVIERALDDVPVAWFPDELANVLTHPGGRIWAASSGDHVFLLRLEGVEAESPRADR